MTDEERVAICKVIAAACMWGQGGIASVIINDLDEALPSSPPWRRLYDEHAKAARRERVGVVTDESELRSWLSRGYWLTNWDEDGCSLFNPPPMNGLHMYVSKPVADAYRKEREAIETAVKAAFHARSNPST